LAKIQHKHLRDLSPEERALPKKFSIRRDVAYLFDTDQPKFGGFRNTKKLNDIESENESSFYRSKSTLKRVQKLYKQPKIGD